MLFSPCIVLRSVMAVWTRKRKESHHEIRSPSLALSISNLDWDGLFLFPLSLSLCSCSLSPLSFPSPLERSPAAETKMVGQTLCMGRGLKSLGCNTERQSNLMIPAKYDIREAIMSYIFLTASISKFFPRGDPHTSYSKGSSVISQFLVLRSVP